MQLIASGKWLKQEKRWNMVVALRQKADAASAVVRKPPRRAAVLSFPSIRQRIVAD
ncbi:MAG TPA: hypothetical protein VMT89_11830 [Candidatus Acidoferrales bacterium]|nr:hypothetical protein [Candidatus Acidoferrales bacterium]